MAFIIEALLLFISAISIGIVGNMVGIGGGVLLMIIFLFLLRIDPVLAGGLSLLTVIASALSGSISNREQGSIDGRLFLDIALTAGVGAVLGSMISYFILFSAFKLYFGITVLSLGFFSFISTRLELRSNRGQRYLNLTFAEAHAGGTRAFRSHRSLALVSLVAGIISGLFGVGIGAVVGTFLTSIKHVHPKVAFSSVVAAMVITSGAGAIAHFFKLGIPPSDLLIIIPLLLGAALGGLTGAHISSHMSFARLRSSQSYVVMLFGALSIIVSLLTMSRL